MSKDSVHREEKMRRKEKSRRVPGSSWIVLLILLSTSVGVGAGIMLIPAPTPPNFESGNRPTQVSVAAQEYSDEHVVEVVFKTGDAIPLIARAEGAVTWPVNGPSNLVSGTVALSLDMQPVVALHTSVPLYRDISVGDCGDDVIALNAELARLGISDDLSNKLTNSTARKWVAFLKGFGSDRSKLIFRLSDILWIPDEVVAVDSWTAYPGDQVLFGSNIGKVRPKLQSIELIFSKDVPVIEGTRELRVFGNSTQFEVNSKVSDEFLKGLEQTNEFTQLLLRGGTLTANGYYSLQAPISAVRVPPSSLFSVTKKKLSRLT